MKAKTPPLDESQRAARIVGQTIAQHSEPLPGDLEAAWEQWSAGIAGVDTRGKVLLRAAFEAGFEAGGNEAKNGK